MPKRHDGVGVPCAAEAREAEARIREAQQKHQELQSEREALRHKAQETRAAEQVRRPLASSEGFRVWVAALAFEGLGSGLPSSPSRLQGASCCPLYPPEQGPALAMSDAQAPRS